MKMSRFNMSTHLFNSYPVGAHVIVKCPDLLQVGVVVEANAEKSHYLVVVPDHSTACGYAINWHKRSELWELYQAGNMVAILSVEAELVAMRHYETEIRAAREVKQKFEADTETTISRANPMPVQLTA